MKLGPGNFNRHYKHVFYLLNNASHIHTSRDTDKHTCTTYWHTYCWFSLPAQYNICSKT